MFPNKEVNEKARNREELFNRFIIQPLASIESQENIGVCIQEESEENCEKEKIIYCKTN